VSVRTKEYANRGYIDWEGTGLGARVLELRLQGVAMLRLADKLGVAINTLNSYCRAVKICTTNVHSKEFKDWKLSIESPGTVQYCRYCGSQVAKHLP
jgi:hypothetical protein